MPGWRGRVEVVHGRGVAPVDRGPVRRGIALDREVMEENTVDPGRGRTAAVVLEAIRGVGRGLEAAIEGDLIGGSEEAEGATIDHFISQDLAVVNRGVEEEGVIGIVTIEVGEEAIGISSSGEEEEMAEEVQGGQEEIIDPDLIVVHEASPIPRKDHDLLKMQNPPNRGHQHHPAKSLITAPRRKTLWNSPRINNFINCI